MTVFQPSDAAEAAEVVAWAAAESQSLEIVAGGSKRGLGRPPRADHRFDVSRLAGIVDYDPAELILTARAATPMAEIEAQLAAKRQMLAFEPPDWRGLIGDDGEPTLGGVLACNLAGPRRVRAGAARDYFLGFSAINGWGDIWKAGGKVVKNVTGSGRWPTSRPPSTASSTITTPIPSPSNGPPTLTRSSPPSDEGIKC